MINAVKKFVKRFATTNNAHRAMRSAQGFAMSVVRMLVLAGVSYIILSPIFGIVSNAFKSISDIYNPLVYLIPEKPTLDNIKYAYLYMDYLPTIIRTFLYTIGMTLLQLLVTSMVGYGFARFRFPGREVLFALVIVTIVIPAQIYTVPLYMQFLYFNIFGFQINLIDTYWSVILLTLTGVGLRSGLYIYIFRQFFRGLPKEIEEAALIDGAGQLRTYITVMLPNAVSAIITVVMFSFVWQYNDTYYASVFMPTINSLSTKLVGVGLVYTARENIRDPNMVRLITNAGIVLTIAPILAVFVALQRYFMEGIERSGIVG